MFPLLAPMLPISEIAKYWSREIQPFAPQQEVLDALIAAFWRGDLGTQGPEDSDQMVDRRVRLLRLLASDPRHPEILFLRDGDVTPPQVTDLPDGRASVDIRTRVHLPPSEIDAPSLEKAFSTLASIKADAYSGVTGPILFEEEIPREAFATYCAKVRQQLPKFWFANQRLAKRASDVSKATVCFETAVKAGRRWTRKEALAHLKEVAPSLSLGEFDRIWKAKAPPHWSRSGRPTTKARSSPTKLI